MADYSEQDLKLVMTASSEMDPLRADLRAVGKTVDQIADAYQERMAIALRDQRGQLQSISHLLSPQSAMIREQVKGEWELVEANRALAELKAAETLRVMGVAHHVPTTQSPPPGVNLPAPPVSVSSAPLASAPPPPAAATTPQAGGPSASSILAQVKALDQQRDAIDRINAAMDPSILERRVDLTRQEADARAKLELATIEQESADPAKIRDRLEMEEKVTAARQKYKDLEDDIAAKMRGPQAPPPTLHEEEVAAVTAQLDAQEDTIKRIAALMDPAVLVRRVELARQEAGARSRVAATEEHVRSLQTDGQKKSQAITDGARLLTKQINDQRDAKAALNALNDPALSSLNSQLDAERGITAEIEHQNALAAIRALADPKALADVVRREGELAKAREALDKAKESERHEQNRPGFFQQLLQDPGKAIGEMTSRAGGFFKEMAAEFTKGGVGGVVDKALGGGQQGQRGGAGATNMLLGGILGGQSSGGSMAGQAGGMAGEAIAGPVGAVVGAKLGDSISSAMESGVQMPAKLISGGFDLIDSSLRELNGALGPVGMGLALASGASQKFVSVVSAVSPALGAVIGPLAALPGALKGILETVTGFAAKSSPGALHLMSMALEDVQAVVGMVALPAVQMMTDGIRLFGDVLANVLPNYGEANSAFREMREALQPLGAAIRDAVKEAGPSIRAGLITAIQLLGEVTKGVVASILWTKDFVQNNWPILVAMIVPPLVAVGVVVGALAGLILGVLSPLILIVVTAAAPFIALGAAILGVGWVIKKVLQGIGLMSADAKPSGTGPGATLDRSSVGAAARPAQYQSLEDYQTAAQLAAYSSGNQGPSQADVPNLLGDIKATLNGIFEFIKNWSPSGVNNKLSDNPATTAVLETLFAPLALRRLL